MARWAAGAKWAAGLAPDDQRDTPLVLPLSEGLGIDLRWLVRRVTLLSLLGKPPRLPASRSRRWWTMYSSRRAS